VEAEIFNFIGLRKLNIIDFNRWAGCTPRSEGNLGQLGFIDFHPPSFEPVELLLGPFEEGARKPLGHCLW
jgi:hypothetical protein